MRLKLISQAARCGLFVLCAALMTACATIPSLRDDGLSPRQTTLNAAQRIEPMLDELTLLVGAGALSDNLTDDIAQFGPKAGELLAVYFDATEACVVIDGALSSDPASGRTCKLGTLRGVYDELDILIWQWAVKTGLDTKAGQAIAAARLVVELSTQPASGGVISGFRKEPDVPLAQFQKRRAELKPKFEALIAAAARRAAAAKTAPAKT